MQRLSLLLPLVAVSACRCNGPSVSSRYGELVFVQPGSAGRELLVTDAEVAAPTVFMGSSTDFTVPVRNVGLEPVTIASVEALEGDEAFSLTDAEGLSVDGTMDGAVTVRFSPPQAADATLERQAHHAKWKLHLSGAAPGSEAITLSVDGSGQARDCYVPATIDLGQVPLLAAITRVVSLPNGGALPQQAAVSTLSGDDASYFFSSLAGGTSEVAAGGALALDVRFSPTEERDYQAQLTVRRDATCPEATVTLLGAGSDEALTWTPDTLDFGRLPIAETGTRLVTFVNNSNAELRLSAAVDSPDFLVPSPPATLAPHASTAVTIACRPTSLGPLSGQATLSVGTEPVTNARINLTCIGGGPRIRVDPSPIDFGQVPQDVATRRRLLVQNVGTPPPAADDTTNNLFLGTNGQLPWFSVVPSDANTAPSDFTVSLVGSYDAASGLPAIAGHNFVEFEVSAKLSGVATRRADLLVYSNDSKEPVVRVPLRATPVAAQSCHDITIDPPGANFGPTPRGSVAQRTITVTNNATDGTPCLISGIGMAPGSSTTFFVGAPVQTSLLVTAGASRPITILAVVPGEANIGDYSRGALELRVGDEATLRTLPIDLVVSQCLVLDPPTVDFGVVKNGCRSATRLVTLYNICSVPIEVTGVTSPSAPFQVTSSPFGAGAVSLDPADHLQVGVAAAPAVTGGAVGSLRVNSVEGDTPQHAEVALSVASNPEGTQSETFTQTASDVDILLVVDDSCSMSDEQSSLAQNFQSFISSASMSPGNWHIGVVSTDVVGDRGLLLAAPGNPTILTPTTPNVAQLFAQNVKLGINGSGLEQPFESMQLALTEPNLSGANQGFVRTNAALAVVVVTDALEQSTRSVGSYVTTLKRLKGNHDELVSLSVVGPFSQPSATCFTEGQVDDGRFHDAVQLTHGVQTDICTSNWAMDLETISKAVFATRKSFPLTGSADTATLVVTVDGRVTTGWHFDGATGAVVFNSAPAAGANIQIDYATTCF